jgi:hypothetical protein
LLCFQENLTTASNKCKWRASASKKKLKEMMNESKENEMI